MVGDVCTDSIQSSLWRHLRWEVDINKITLQLLFKITVREICILAELILYQIASSFTKKESREESKQSLNISLKSANRKGDCYSFHLISTMFGAYIYRMLTFDFWLDCFQMPPPPPAPLLHNRSILIQRHPTGSGRPRSKSEWLPVIKLLDRLVDIWKFA